MGSAIRTPLVSVIIPSKNSEKTIAECVRSIQLQSYKPTEVIVVDAFSADSTREIAREGGALVISTEGERSLAKNLGAKIAKGKYLFFVDADHKLDPTSIAECVEAIGKADGVLVTDQDIARGSPISQLVASRRKILSYDPLNVAVRFVDKEVFDRLGGFDLGLYVGEDLDFHRRFLQNGYKFVYSSVKEWHLNSPLDLKGLLKRSLHYAPNYLQFASKNPLISLRRLNPLRVVAAWKRTDTRSSDLPSVVFLGLLSSLFLVVGILFHPGRDPRSFPQEQRRSELERDSGVNPSKKLMIANYDKQERTTIPSDC